MSMQAQVTYTCSLNVAKVTFYFIYDTAEDAETAKCQRIANNEVFISLWGGVEQPGYILFLDAEPTIVYYRSTYLYSKEYIPLLHDKHILNLSF